MVLVPAEKDLAARNPARVTLAGTEVCNGHGRRMTVGDLLVPEGKARITREMLAGGKDAPDWDRARLVLEPVGLEDPIAAIARKIDLRRRLGGL